jgi:hypothetical protein
MTLSTQSKPYVLQSDEKATPVILYMEEALAWGEVVTKEIIRVSTWLRTPMVPPYITLFDAQVLYGYGTQAAPIRFQELHISLPHIYGIHMMPPAADPVDFDASEPNRKMEPATVMIGPFRFDGHLRMATSADLTKYLDVMKQTFTSIYDVEITQPLRTGMKGLHVPMALVRSEVALFGRKI